MYVCVYIYIHVYIVYMLYASSSFMQQQSSGKYSVYLSKKDS